MPATISLNTIPVYEPSTEKPWNATRVQHLFSRLGHGANLSEIQTALALAPDILVDNLIDDVLNLSNPEAPLWANWTYDDYNDDQDLFFEHQTEMSRRWTSEMPDATQHIRSKLSMFWHNHFVTEYEIYDCTSYMWHYYNLLHTNVLGNFKTFVEEMGKNPAMLNYLDGDQNVVDEPNENYARELMELFTMGENNGYTQNDIVEVARALTGWTQNMYNCELPSFDPGLHDFGQKTIFGQTGNWNYDDVHELIFTVRQTQVSHYICEKIYTHFIYNTPDENIVTAMAQCFVDNNWELAPVFRMLFKSEHFFEDRFINSKIKSPLECFHSLFRIAGLEKDTNYTDDTIDDVMYYGMELGQYIFNPKDVAGWPGQRAWVNENTLTLRWSFMQNILFNTLGNNADTGEKLRQLAIDLTDSTENDAVVVTQALAQHFLNTTLDDQNLETAVQYFKGELPDNYFDEGIWNLYFEEVPEQIVNLLFYLTRLPEWQLI